MEMCWAVVTLALCLPNGVKGRNDWEEWNLPPLIIRAHLQKAAAICGVRPSFPPLMTVSVKLISLQQEAGGEAVRWGGGGMQVLQTKKLYS